jgi:hypothetical protein
MQLLTPSKDVIRESANSIVVHALFVSAIGGSSFIGLGIAGFLINFFDPTQSIYAGFYLGASVWMVLLYAACAFGLCFPAHANWEEKNKNTLDMIIDFIKSGVL